MINQESVVKAQGHWSASVVTGQVRGQLSWVKRHDQGQNQSGVTGQSQGSLVRSRIMSECSKSEVKGHWSNDFQGSRVLGQEFVVKGHDQGSEDRVSGQRSRVIASVTGQSQGSLVKGQWSGQGSRVSGRGS